MKNLKILILALCVCTCSGAFASCSSTPTLTNSDSNTSTQQNQSQIPILLGEWKQTNGNSETNYQIATIKENVIEVYWINKETDTKSLYWAGTFTAPTETKDEYSFVSENNKEKTESALLASGDDTKTFLYQKGELSYDVTAIGTTQTVRLEKQ